MRVSLSLAVAALATLASALVTPRAPRPAPAALDIEVKADLAVGGNNNAPFILQTRTKNGGSHSGLYVYAYHTGAGLNDAMLDTQKSVANQATAFTGDNGAHFSVLFKLGGSPYELMPSTGPTPYPGLSPVRISVNGAPPSSNNAFYFDGGSLKWTDGFAGWLACTSGHGSLENPRVPGVQLFYRSTPGLAPGGCSDIDLVAVH